MKLVEQIRSLMAVRFTAAGERRFIGSTPTLAALGATLALSVAVLVGGNTYIDFLVSLFCAYAVAALGYNIALGYSGLMIFGQAGFLAVGAYTYGLLQAEGVGFLVAFAGALVSSTLLGILVGLAVLRTRDLYLALVTFAFAQAAVVAITLIPAANFYDGIVVSRPTESRSLLTIPVLLMAILVMVRLVRSAGGRAMVMVKDDELAASAVGVPVARTKVIAFVLSSMYSGAAGAMLAMGLGYIAPANFSLELTIFLATIVVVGGLASVWATVVASGFFVYLNDQLSNAGSARDFIYAGLLLLVLAILPGGMASVPASVMARMSRRRRAATHAEGDRLADVHTMSIESATSEGTKPGRTSSSHRTGLIEVEAPAPRDGEGGVDSQVGLRGEGVTVRFGGVVAVDDLNFTIEAGTTMGLVGPNGAGKSTLLNAISGVVPTTGSIRLTGHQVTELVGAPAHARAGLGIGRTFQHSRLFESMSVIEQLVAGAHSRADYRASQALVRSASMIRREKDMLEHAHALVDELGLFGREYDRIDELPGPHRRLVDVGRALMSEPNILLLDEVGAGLSAEEKLALCETLEAISARRQLTMVVVEHDLDFVRRLAARTIVLSEGRLIMADVTDVVLSDAAVVSAYMGDDV